MFLSLKSGILIASAFIFIIFFSSCTTGNKLSYFKDLPDSAKIILPAISYDERVIEPGDFLNIALIAKEQDAMNFFNAGGGSNQQNKKSSEATANTGHSGYLVNTLGQLEFPIIGIIQVNGLTVRQLKDKLTDVISKYVKDPLVEVRFSSFNVTVIGEVRGPGTFTLPMQRTTIFEGLAAAGDLPQTAKRYNIIRYRDYKGERTITKLDLRSKKILYDSDLFQLKHNDVIYVQPSRNTLFREDFSFITAVSYVFVGLASIVFTIINN